MLVLCFCLCFSTTSKRINLIITLTPKSLKNTLLGLLAIIYRTSTLIVDIHTQTNNTLWLLLIQLFTLLTILIIGLSFPIIINNSMKSQYLEQLTKNYEKQIQTQAQHYTAIAQNNWELRRFQHDSKNLKVGLSELLESGKNQEALEMLKHYYEMSLGTKSSLLRFDTGNGIVDALLADKQQTAQEMHTTITFEGAVPSAGIPPTDLCVMFGNTLDNALDACRKLPADEPKTIRVVCKCMGGYLMVYISNPVAENVTIHNNTIPTTKEDKSSHGFGLYSLERVVKKHDGELKLTCQNNLFETSIDLMLDV